jgi:hypothetical protein
MRQNEIICQCTNTLHSTVTTKRVGITVTLYALFLEDLGLCLSRYSDYPDGGLRDFPHSLRQMPGYHLDFGHDRFLSNPLQFIHTTIQRYVA